MALDPALISDLQRAARGLGHPPADAEDLAQECMLAYTSGSFQGRSSLRTWLYRVLWNKHVDFLRRRGRPEPSSPRAEAPIESDVRDRVREALGSLPDIPRAVLVLRYFQGLSYREIAEILERPEGTLHADCFRALEALHAGLVQRHGLEEVKRWL